MSPVTHSMEALPQGPNLETALLDHRGLRDLGRGHVGLRNRALHSAWMTLDHAFSRPLASKWVAGPRERLQQKIRDELEARPPGKIHPIPRVRDIGPEEFYAEWVRPGLPVLLEGAASDWPCTGKWSMSWFQERYGDDEVVVTEGTVQTVKSVHKDTVLLRDVIANNDPEHTKYLRFHPMLAEHPELTDDFPIDWFNTYRGRKSRYYQAQFFIGTEGTATGTHNAQMANLFALVSGEKEWYLWPTTYTAYMDPPTTRSTYRLSRHNTGNIFEPAYKHMDGLFVEMKAGDVLWNPPFYWHSVRNCTDTIGVGYRWKNDPLARRMSKTMYLLDLFAVDPSWYAMWKMCRRENRLAEGRSWSRAQE